MEVKGTAVKSINEFIINKCADRYDKWSDALPDESGKLFDEGILTNILYPVREAAIIPTKKMCNMFFTGQPDGAWESSWYSAETALTGTYKLYVKLSIPMHIIDRASGIFSPFYTGSEITVENKDENTFDVVFKKLSQPSEIIEHRIAGWIYIALELSGCKNVKVDITESMTKGKKLTKMNLSWN